MLSRLFRKLSKRIPPNRDPARGAGKESGAERRVYSAGDLEQMALPPALSESLALFEEILGQNSDIVFRRFRLVVADLAEAAVIFADGMTDKGLLDKTALKPLMLESRQAGLKPAGKNLLEFVKDFVITSSDVHITGAIDEMVAGVLYGDAVLLIDGESAALVISNKGWQSRQIEEPKAEMLVRGPREGFTESLRTNTTLLRRRLRSPNLVLEEMNIGRVTATGVSIAYIRGIASPDLVEEVRRRLQRIDTDSVLESGYIEEFIEDDPYSPFPQIVVTERPDLVAGELLEGKVAVLTDGTPFALVVPVTFNALLQSPEDYYANYILATALRVLRYIAFAVSLLLPSLYIAVTTFHQEMIPTRLLISIAAAREGVPFPALVEALLMEFTFEALREAGVRLPRAIGQAVSIVGALVIGQAAVQANIVSPLMVIIVAITGIASFTIPAYNMGVSMRLLRFPIMILAGTLGLFGVMAGLLTIIIHLAGLRSFGAPYLAPLAPFHAGDLKDVVVRAPWWAMDKRPAETAKVNPRRQARGLKPSPPARGETPEEDRGE